MESLGWQTTNSVHLHTIFPQSLSSVGCSPGPDRTTHEGRAHSHGHHHGGAHRWTHTWTHTCTEQNSNLNTSLLGLTTVNSNTLPLKNTSTSNLQCLLESRQAALGVIYRVRWAGPAPGWASAAALTSAVWTRFQSHHNFYKPCTAWGFHTSRMAYNGMWAVLSPTPSLPSANAVASTQVEPSREMSASRKGPLVCPTSTEWRCALCVNGSQQLVLFVSPLSYWHHRRLSEVSTLWL